MTLNFALRWVSCWIFLWAIWALPVGAQSQTRTQVAPKSKAATAPPIRQTPSRLVSADVTAQLQAAAAAAAHASSLATPAGPAPTPGDASPLAASNTSSSSTAAAAAAAAAAAVPLPVPDVQPLATTPDRTSAASPEQAVAPFVSPELLIAQQIHQGNLPCELGASVRVEADTRQPGFFHVHGKGFRYRMFPVLTSTGALRLEDKKAGAVWLQLANKSMLMDQKRGRRMADECAHPDQLAYAQAMKTNPPPSLIDTKGLGR
jgi:hypothetical protein